MEQPSSPSASSSLAFRRVAFPRERRLVLDTLRLGHNKPMMHGLLELDVTLARRMLREHRDRTGESLSFTAFVLACLGRAVAAHPEVHAIRDWFGRMVLFKDVDATTIVEVKVDGRPFALAHVVRGINRRSAGDIHDEIRSVQTSGMRSLPSVIRVGSRLFLMLPGFLRRLVYRALLRFPQLAKRHTGTMLVTAVGMFSSGPGWGFSAPGIHNLSIVVGGIAPRPPTVAGESEPREVLFLTVSANHDMVDGAPLARFARDFTRRLESAEGLADSIAQRVSVTT
ncbi:MAG: 2-oxo acid dehydrogenase subunit E2 [Deltaproteobacteria bacterium]|nr:2-oxo acid dehydrogenase subunit E2 [Deltaproteobacteria bacterium]